MARLHSAGVVCAFLAGQGDGLLARLWLGMQILGWLLAAGIAMNSACSWARNWGRFHSEVSTMIGGLKTLGFMILDVLAVPVLLNARRVRHHAWAWSEGLVAPGGNGKARAARPRGRAAALVTAGLLLAVVQALYWSMFLWDNWPRWETNPRYMTLTAVASVVLVLTAPGLVCSVFPALVARQEAGIAFRAFVDEVRAATGSSQCDWRHLLTRYGELDTRIGSLSAELSPVVRAWFWALGLSAALHGVSIWLWMDKIHLAPPHAVYGTQALAVLYGLIFLAVFFAFAGMGRLQEELVGLTKSQLGVCQVDGLEPLLMALQHFKTTSISWTVELWQGSTMEINQLRGRFLSVAFLLNIMAKNLPRLLHLWCAAGIGKCKPKTRFSVLPWVHFPQEAQAGGRTRAFSMPWTTGPLPVPFAAGGRGSSPGPVAGLRSLGLIAVACVPCRGRQRRQSCRHRGVQ
uniref:Uncharacterized protein n=1 Tax=Alexandrium monilatum TaxID=311494 RepID=A0A7S4T4T6_9DINO|mmetsp:Transcript_70546/g.210366  ORF Transcript_70546/g.210366 Transcript_70546/m.210366 type:complete len:460 (+) Transcript_70546:72-1451(+)